MKQSTIKKTIQHLLSSPINQHLFMIFLGALPARLRSAAPWPGWGPGSAPTFDSSPMRGQYLR